MEITKSVKKKTVREETRVLKKARKSDTNITISINDFFYSHFASVMVGKEVAESLMGPSAWKSVFQQWHSLGRVMFEYPQITNAEQRHSLLDDKDSVISSIPTDFPQQLDISQCSLKSEIIEKIESKKLSSLQQELLSVMCQYVDLYYPEASHNQWTNIKLIYSIHCINHIIKTRSQIIQHNEELELGKKDEWLCRDQGFTRPKVLILVPFKHSAYTVIKHMMSLVDREVMYKKKFEREFGPQDQGSWHVKKLEKPKDFQTVFDGDISEDFTIGITLTKKSLKLYAKLYESDIIIGSPLGVRYVIESTGASRDIDFLSSIEILVLDQADIFQMQNWEHILIIMESLNQTLQNIENLHSDLMRIRLWCLDGFSHIYRQTIIFSSTLTDLNRSLVVQGKNYAGRFQVLNFMNQGSVSDVTVKAELILQKVSNANGTFCPDAQFSYFTQHVLPQLRLNQHGHTLIYIPDYCDYIRVVKYMKEDGGTSIATLNEYMVDEVGKIAKAKSLFFDGKRQYLIYTERLHFYKRYKVKGIHHIFFYGLPTFPHYFAELCNMMAEEYQNPRGAPLFGLNTITALYQSSEVTKLVALLGTAQAAALLKSDKAVHMCTIGI